MILLKMQPSHIDGVKALLDECFGAGAWSRESVAAQLDNPVSYCAVAVDGERVVGYIAFEQIVDEGSLIELAVDPAYRRKGVGRKLVELMLTSCDGVKTICLEVRAGNLAAISLYQAMGFEAISVRRDYYDNPKEHAVIMIYQVREGHPEEAAL
jgi:ribosomal-protein-alanine N-acetyltransferase